MPQLRVHMLQIKIPNTPRKIKDPTPIIKTRHRQIHKLYMSVCVSRSVHVWFFVTPWTVACQAPLSMEFSRQEYWRGSHSLLQGIFPTQAVNPGLLHCRKILYCLSHQGSPLSHDVLCLVAQLCPTLCDCMDYSLPVSSVHGDSPGKNTGVGCYVIYLWDLFIKQSYSY